MTTTLFDSKGSAFTVDTADLPLVGNRSWTVNVNRDSSVTAFAIKPDGKHTTAYLHRVIMSPAPGLQVDHIDGNPANNTRANLRIVTRRENLLNRKRIGGSKAGKSKYRGVSPSGKKWIAKISVNGVTRVIGRFQSEDDAARAYDREAAIENGAFARLNFGKNQIAA